MSARSVLVACAILGGLLYVIIFSTPSPAASAFAVAQAPNPSDVTESEPRGTGQPADLSSSAIAALIVRESRNAYYATGHPCACPDDLMRNGRRCGGNSAYVRPGVPIPCAPPPMS